MKELKEKIAAVTCVLAFLAGFGLTIAGFCVPPIGEVSNSVLWILGQCLLYCGAILGISEHYNNKLKEIEQHIDTKLQK